MRNLPESITRNLTGFVVSGAASVRLWDGTRGKIVMNQTRVPLDALSKTKLLSCINDGGYGAESIESARVIIEANYSGVRVPVREFTVRGLRPYYRHAMMKRGI